MPQDLSAAHSPPHGEALLTAEQAAAELGVSVATLYAYVSRKSLRSERVAGARGRRYWRSEIARLKSAASSGDIDPEASALCPWTAITLISPEGPWYRGQSAVALAQVATLEDVAALLWMRPPGEIAAATPPTGWADLGAHLDRLGGLAPIDRVLSLFPLIERASPRAFDLSPQGFARTGLDVMRWLAALALGAPPSDEPLHLFIARHARGGRGLEDPIRRMLVLSADHELDPTTYAVRAVANTGVTPYRAAMAGLTAAMGRRLTFGRTQGLARLVDDILAGPEPREAVLRRVREGEALPGFGSPLYPDGDPRARALLDVLEAAFGDDPEVRRLRLAIEAAAEATGLQPDFALPNAVLARRLGIDFGPVYLGRVVGWIAHAAEQYQTQDLKRPRAMYVGPLPRP